MSIRYVCVCSPQSQSDSPFLLQAILGDDIDAHSSAGSIRGTFNVSESLYITTTEGAMELQANLLGGRAPDHSYPDLDNYELPRHTLPTRLSMITGNG